MLFVSTVWHHGSANTSEDTRHMMQFHYSNRWIHRHFQPYLDSNDDDQWFRYRPEILAAATPRQRRLLNEHPPTNTMNGSCYDLPLSATVATDPNKRPPQATPMERLPLTPAPLAPEVSSPAISLLVTYGPILSRLLVIPVRRGAGGCAR